jgi:MraZ protein
VVKSGNFGILIQYFYPKNHKRYVTNYIGEYNCKVDSKGRMMMPAGLLKQFPADLRERFVINRSVFQRCLVLYPMDLWNEIAGDLSKLNRFSRENDAFIRQFTNGAFGVEVDATNRILLPKRLMEYASIKSDLVMVANLNKIEIWSAESYDSVTGSYDPDSFAQLAEKVMGKLGNPGMN